MVQVHHSDVLPDPAVRGPAVFPCDALANSVSQVLLLAGVNAVGPQAGNAKEKYGEHANRASKVPGFAPAQFFEANK